MVSDKTDKKDSESKKEDKKVDKPKKKDTQNKILATIALIAIVTVIAVVIYGNYNTQKLADIETKQDTNQVLALVNGEEITAAQLDKDYRFFFFVTGYPPEYQSLITKTDFLNQTIAQTLLLQEAMKLGYEVDNMEAEKQLETTILQNMLTKEEFEKNVKDANFTMDDVIEYSAMQLTLSKFIEETIFSYADVSDKEIKAFYEENKEFMDGSEIEDVTSLIKQELEMEKQRELLQTAIDMLMEGADIKILEEPSTELTPMATAELSPEELGKCIAKHDVSTSTVIFFHSSWCPHCKSMIPIVEEMESVGYSFHYAETSENIGTEVIECFEDNMQSGVPQFICAGSGKIAVGAMPADKLVDFADNCGEI